MAKSTESILTIDIGGASLKMAEFTCSPLSGGLRLEKFAVQPMPGVEDDPVGAFAETYREMIKEHGFRCKNVRMTLSGQASFARLSKLPPITDSAGANKIVEFEARQTIPYAMEDVVWDYQLIQHTIEGDSEDAGTDEFEALFVAVKSDLITSYTDIVQASGKDVLSVGIAPVAMFNAAFVNRTDEESCNIYLNIGAKSTNLVISESNRIFVRSIPIAGDTITQTVSRELDCTMEEAEVKKVNQGSVALGGVYAEPESQEEAIISKVSRNVMNRLFAEISRSINVWRSTHGGSRPTKMFLSGGASLMRYVLEFFQEKMHMPVEYLNVFNVSQVGDGVDTEALLDNAPMFSEMIGSALRSLSVCPVQINLIPDSIKEQRILQSKKPYFYFSCASIILCLAVTYMGINQNNAYREKLVNEASSRYKNAETLNNKVLSTYRDTENIKSEYQKYVQIASARGKWADLMEDMQNLLPDNIWLTDIEPFGDIAANKNEASEERSRSRRSRRGRGDDAEGSAAASAVVKDLANIKGFQFKGYALGVNTEKDEPTAAIGKRLASSKYFLADEKEMEITDYRNEAGKNNISYFAIKLKLKEQIEK